MVEPSPQRLDAVFQALAHPTRRAMLRRLADGERSISELGEPFGVSLEAVSKHVRTLERADLVRRTVRGRTHFCALHPRPLADVREWLRFYEEFWRDSLDALEAALEAEDARTGAGHEAQASDATEAKDATQTPRRADRDEEGTPRE